ncbi:DNA-3-methyladenine glycosylase I [Thalassovita taeanensis]|uniref:DNA-3-methyladenine glycosylase I n=1 Tax=Thalassovita taeanensis TaxID=657014 RepID=A0A1H9BZ07_9RHOB|nr:DNA-3-methyladenine glycosylase I [Thalassovita taeanensis]SEP94094.1 DNA-3-methyladenine glycosylase I [Thalassovita taeanensis]
MRDYDEIYAIANDRKSRTVEGLLSKPLSPDTLAATSDHRWLATMAKCIFQAGFNWKVVEAKWNGFEAAFEGFEPARVGFYCDEDLDRLLSDERIVRNGAKVVAVIDNTRFILEIARDHSSAGAFFAAWPNNDFIGLLRLMSKRGARLGGTTGQRMLRAMGRDGFILSTDVATRLIAEGIVAKQPSSQSDMKAVQAAFNTRTEQSGCSLTEISQTLAYSV